MRIFDLGHKTYSGGTCAYTHTHIKTLFKTIQSDNKFISKEYNDVNPQKKAI